MTSLRGLISPDTTANPHLFHTILNLARKNPNRFHLHWIPSHQGHIGNEIADLEAKKAAADPSIPYHLYEAYTSKKQMKTSLDLIIKNTLKSNWQDLTGGRPKVLELVPTYTHFQKYLANNQTYPLINNYLTGHLPLGEHLFNKNKIDSPLCPACGCNNTPQHLFNDCKKYQQQRRTLKKTLKTSTDTNLTDILNQVLKTEPLNVDALKAYNSFLKETVYSTTKQLKRPRPS
jgi:hypothetical protein